MAYLERVVEPHKHKLPPGWEYSSPANDRACFRKNKGAHRGRKKVSCDIEGCTHNFGIACDNCKRIV